MNLPSGLHVALPTPFTADGEVDLPAFRNVVRHVRSAGVDALVVLGTTGEAATLDDEERDRLIVACCEEADGRPVIVGCGTPSTRRSAAFVRRARELGAQGALVVTPYYNKPTQDGLVAHYRALATAAPGFPLVAYNVPSRTGISISLSALQRIWQIDEVVALKESTGDSGRFRDIAQSMPQRKVLLCGDDHLTVAAAPAGARGLVSVVANVVPDLTLAMTRAACSGDGGRAQGLLHRLMPLAHALFLESNPIPLKAALELIGLAGAHVRLPLTPAQPATVAALRDALLRVDQTAGKAT